MSTEEIVISRTFYANINDLLKIAENHRMVEDLFTFQYKSNEQKSTNAGGEAVKKGSMENQMRSKTALQVKSIWLGLANQTNTVTAFSTSSKLVFSWGRRWSQLIPVVSDQGQSSLQQTNISLGGKCGHFLQ